MLVHELLKNLTNKFTNIDLSSNQMVIHDSHRGFRWRFQRVGALYSAKLINLENPNPIHFGDLAVDGIIAFREMCLHPDFFLKVSSWQKKNRCFVANSLEELVNIVAEINYFN